MADHPERPPPSRSSAAERILEALLFAGGQPLSAQALSAFVGPSVDVGAALMALKRAYAGRGVELVEAGGAWRFQTAPDLAGLFTQTAQKAKKLPKAALETLAIIAYHQPVTRTEMEALRGVALSKGTLDLLLDLDWVRPRGRRRSPGRPVTYGTTDVFLSHFGLISLDALPGKDDLTAAGYIDARTAHAVEVPRPDAAVREDEDPLPAGQLEATFFTDHLAEEPG
jgi:segregation and condensation protein B